MSEAAKYRALVTKYCVGNIIDIGSGGHPVTPNAIQVELSDEKFAWYNSGHPPASPIQWRGDEAALYLPFKDDVVDTVFSSHLIEDFLDWDPVLFEWARVLKPGGHLIILLPDKDRWATALANGQPPNNFHTHEGRPGELTECVQRLALPLEVLEDRLTDHFPGDYSILFAARKTSS